MRPMPVPPPVTTATKPVTSKRVWMEKLEAEVDIVSRV